MAYEPMALYTNCLTKLHEHYIDWWFAVLRTGAVNSASGSAYAEFGNTKVIVSV